MIRAWFRVWLGIDRIENYVSSIQGMESEAMKVASETPRLQSELRAQIQELKELREMVNNPKLRPIVARTSQEYRKLMEDVG